MTFRQRLETADAYIALRLYVEANDELERIAPPLRATREVFLRREKIYEATGSVDLLAAVRRALAMKLR